jgi:hypothetical protein
MTHVVVEYIYDPPLSDEDFQKNGEKLGSCLQANNVAWVATYLATDRTRRVCVFRAADAESVRTAFRSAGLTFARVWPAAQFGP